ncbi:hypothetical protein E2C01_078727 [Portunus trituberculatus]|uniref:Uncharacterized protein n=1 Tax=Portunus trituberculatus TaxID=210409 RepID=A0A5B7IJK4_PORTR|nr:hypothetical protein [Portunus trituberculatus]
MVLEKSAEAERDCNTLDFVRDSAKKYVPSLYDTIHELFLKMSETMVLGEIISASSTGAVYTVRR